MGPGDLTPAPLAALDARAFFAVYAAGDGGLRWLAVALSAIGSGWAALALLPMWAFARARRFAVALSAVLATSAVAVVALKALFGRVRPCAALPGVHALCAAPTDPSFPSGHACGSFAFAVFVLVVLLDRGALPRSPPARAAVAALVLAAAAGVAWSRVYLGVHFPADVTAGATLGAAFGAVGARVYLATAPSVQARRV